MASSIHPTAIVHPAALLGADVEVGPFAIVGAGAAIGDRTRILASAFVADEAAIGPDCEIHMGAIVGHDPQVRGARPPFGDVVVGPRNIIREHVTIHRALEPGEVTRIGSDNLLLAGCHVAHNCRIGNGTPSVNGALLAGHVRVDDRAYISGNAVVHQFCRIGELSIIGGGSAVGKDVPPFMLVQDHSRVRGVNALGMRRAGMTEEQRRRVRMAYSLLYRSGLSVTHAVARLESLRAASEIATLLAFIAGSRRGICAGGARGRRLRLAMADIVESET